MDFNEDFDFEPAENLESVMDSNDDKGDIFSAVKNSEEDIFKNSNNTVNTSSENIFNNTNEEEIVDLREEFKKAKENASENIFLSNGENQIQSTSEMDKIKPDKIIPVLNKVNTNEEQKNFIENQSEPIPISFDNLDSTKKNLSSENQSIVQPISKDIFNQNDFSDKFNKLQNEEKILNMNPELQHGPKKKTLIQKYAVAFPIFAFVSTLILCLYIFVSNTKADETNLIKIEEKHKFGYIDRDGNKIVKAKYISGSDFYRGYAVVKNQNNLTGIIDNTGDLVSHFGDYFYIERFSNCYIVSKFTNQGLKLGLLDENLRPITRFKYDNITYAKNNTFLFSRDDIMGILNPEGNEIYTFAVDETDDKDISIEVSEIDSDSNKTRYAKVKVNKSSTIINLSTGNVVYKYTLDDIIVHDNNVFSIKTNKENNKYFVIDDDKVKYETSDYKLIRMEDYNSGIVICLKSDMTYDYINLNSRKKMNEYENYEYIYGSGLIVEHKRDLEKNKDVYTVKSSKKKISEFYDVKLADDKIVNGMIKAYTKDMKYNFINTTNGKYINEKEYDDVLDFDKFGYAIVQKDNLYGVINKNGKEVIPIKYQKIKLLNEELFDNLKKNYDKELFIYANGEEIGIISVKNDTIINASYEKFKYVSTKYPIIVGQTKEKDILINLESGKEFDIKVDDDIEVYENYIFVDNKYYNYDGKKIYTIGQEG